MRVSGCQYLPDAGGPGGHSPAMVTGPGLRLTSGPGPPGASPGITDEIEVFRLGAGVVGRPGSTRGDSLPTLKREKNVSPSASEILWPHIARGKHGIGDWTGTGGGCGGGEAHLPIICPAEHLSE